MKLSKIFHFLYFSVLAIPLISIPIFAIYSQNHEINDNTLTINESYWEVEDKFETNEVNNLNDIHDDYIYTYEASQIHGILSDYGIDMFGQYISYYEPNEQNLIEVEGYLEFYANPNNLYVYTGDDLTIPLNTLINVVFTANYDYNEALHTEGYAIGTKCNNVPKAYIYHENTPITYDDTDIMSQFLYQEYNFMDKYLGIYKFQPFNGIYNWIGNTFFGGTSPIVFTIFYQWLAYWLFVSICWLIFDVLLYVPLLAHRWLDKAGLE